MEIVPGLDQRLKKLFLNNKKFELPDITWVQYSLIHEEFCCSYDFMRGGKKTKQTCIYNFIIVTETGKAFLFKNTVLVDGILFSVPSLEKICLNDVFFLLSDKEKDISVLRFKSNHNLMQYKKKLALSINNPKFKDVSFVFD